MFTIDPRGRIEREHVELSTWDQGVAEQCDPTDQDECWRIPDEGVTVEHSADGGSSWEPELELSDDQIEAVFEDIGDDCGGPGRITPFDLAVLPTDGEPLVVVPIGQGGLYLRDEDATVAEVLDRPAVRRGDLTRPARPRCRR